MPTKAPLIQGAYTARSYIAEAQRCINLYPEVDPQDAPFPTTHYPCPGLTLQSQPPTPGPGRGLYRSTDGRLFVVVGDTLYFVTSGGQWQTIGTVANLPSIVSMCDNATDLVAVDGSSGGYDVNMSNLTMKVINDKAFYGSTLVNYADTYFIYNKPASQEWYYGVSNSVSFNPLTIAAKTAYADPLVAAIVIHREIWLIGQLTTEVWYNTGASDFTYGIMPGVFIEHGCAAPYSIARQDLQLFWVSQDLQGHSMIFMGESYAVKRISTYAIENEIQKYSTVADAVGFTYQQNGHTFYQVTFPSGDATWVYDVSTALWHQRASIDNDGNLHRHRAILSASCYGLNFALDFENGNLYSFDQDNYTDNGAEIVYIRSFPHIKDNDVRVSYKYFIADMECGNAPGILTPDAPLISLRWSDDGGFTWSNGIQQSMGGGGQYIKSVKWNRLGLARDRVFELSWSANVRTALNGAVIDPEAMAS